MKRIVLRLGREKSPLRHHPWVFSGAVASGEAEAGDTVEVASASGTALGFGWYSPASQIRVRMVSFDPSNGFDDSAFVERAVAEAIGRRADFLANDETDAFRLINAENDSLPGVVADFYAGWIVCQFTSAGADRRRDSIAGALMRFAPGALGVSERTDLKDRAKEGLGCEMAWRNLAGAEPPELVEIREGPCRFFVDLRRGHKTGFYLDQRDARRLVGSLANGMDVLNCFSYTGGFGLYARACGAASVTNVDISGEAIALARKNESLGHFCGTAMEYVEADVFKFLRQCRDSGRSFDMVVLDPPKFAAAKSQVVQASRGYKDINLLAMKLLRPNGMLATFSCSGAMTGELFDKVLAEAATDAGRDFQIVARTRQGADHPVALSFPEGHYLKGAVLRAVS